MRWVIYAHSFVDDADRIAADIEARHGVRHADPISLSRSDVDSSISTKSLTPRRIDECALDVADERRMSLLMIALGYARPALLHLEALPNEGHHNEQPHPSRLPIDPQSNAGQQRRPALHRSAVRHRDRKERRDRQQPVQADGLGLVDPRARVLSRDAKGQQAADHLGRQPLCPPPTPIALLARVVEEGRTAPPLIRRLRTRLDVVSTAGASLQLSLVRVCPR